MPCSRRYLADDQNPSSLKSLQTYGRLTGVAGQLAVFINIERALGSSAWSFSLRVLIYICSLWCLLCRHTLRAREWYFATIINIHLYKGHAHKYVFHYRMTSEYGGGVYSAGLSRIATCCKVGYSRFYIIICVTLLRCFLDAVGLRAHVYYGLIDGRNICHVDIYALADPENHFAS